MATKAKHKKIHPTKQYDLLDILGYEFNDSWAMARENTQHRPGRH